MILTDSFKETVKNWFILLDVEDLAHEPFLRWDVDSQSYHLFMREWKQKQHAKFLGKSMFLLCYVLLPNIVSQPV
jgi:hypothetical protein